MLFYSNNNNNTKALYYYALLLLLLLGLVRVYPVRLGLPKQMLLGLGHGVLQVVP